MEPANAVACGLVGQPRTTQRYPRKPKPDDGLRERVAQLAAERPRFGYRRLTALLRRDGVQVWHGRVHRVTKERKRHSNPSVVSGARVLKLEHE